MMWIFKVLVAIILLPLLIVRINFAIFYEFWQEVLRK